MFSLYFLSKNVSSALECGLPYPNFHLGRYIVGYTDILSKSQSRFCSHVAVKLNFRPYMESQPQNHEFRNNPETFHPFVLGQFEPQEPVRYYVYYNIGLVTNA